MKVQSQANPIHPFAAHIPRGKRKGIKNYNYFRLEIHGCGCSVDIPCETKAKLNFERVFQRAWILQQKYFLL